MFVDSDDVACPVGIERLVRVLGDNPEVDYVYGQVLRVGEDFCFLAGRDPVGATFSAAPVEAAGYHWHTMGAVYRKTYLEHVGLWNERLTGSQDWEYQARVKLGGGVGRFVEVVVGYWRQHEGARVGAANFRPDYVRSVMIASCAILALARAKNRCDRALEERLAKRLMIHALEWGMHGFPVERRECFHHALACLTSSPKLELLIRLVLCSPPQFDGWLWKRLVRR
jgi:hypothetical protein